MIIIESKRKKIETLQRQYPGAVIADVTSQARDGLVRLSSTKYGMFVKNALALKSVDFESDVIRKLLNCTRSRHNFKIHILKLLRKGLIGHDDYSFAVM